MGLQATMAAFGVKKPQNAKTAPKLIMQRP
jgi:hypothetical protein